MQYLANNKVLNGETVITQLFATLQFSLGGFHIPVTEVSPEKGVNLVSERRNLEVGKALFEVGSDMMETTQNPVIVIVEQIRMDAAYNGLEARVIGHGTTHLSETHGVPELVAKVTSDLNALFRKQNIRTRRCNIADTETEAIGTIFLDQVKWIWRVAEGFRHFTPLLVTDETVNKNVFKRDTLSDLFVGQIFGIVPIEFDARHDHTGDPKKDNVETCNQGGSRIPKIELLLLGFCRIRPTEISHWPEVGGRPGVEHIFFLLPVFGISWTFDRNVDVVGIFKVEIRTLHSFFIPDRDAVPPPELATNAPILNSVKPVEVSLFPTIRMEFNSAIFNRALGFLDLWVFKEPLL